ncbi:hypothetical protein J6590_029497 [Homalodisca vitripennis]|nr:hypothetical protein J6590_029497 [Homalodisca vitripennis]
MAAGNIRVCREDAAAQEAKKGCVYQGIESGRSNHGFIAGPIETSSYCTNQSKEVVSRPICQNKRNSPGNIRREGRGISPGSAGMSHPETPGTPRRPLDLHGSVLARITQLINPYSVLYLSHSHVLFCIQGTPPLSSYPL